MLRQPFRPARVLLLALQIPNSACLLANVLNSLDIRKVSTLRTKMTSDLFRHDGVRITHDPFAPGMAEKYGQPGQTDNEGFDPYRDSVGAGIYGGIVKRHPETGEVVIGKQYQNHNPRPGPVYAGGGYSPSSLMLDDVVGKLVPLLDKFPDLVNDITTGGAQPLHMCGMSSNKQHAVQALVERGADIEAQDSYGMTALHRMASNNLADGARVLLESGADVFNKGKVGVSPMSIAKDSAANAVMKVLKEAEKKAEKKNSSGTKEHVTKLNVLGSGEVELNGDYFPKTPGDIPIGFAKVCDARGWNTNDMWAKLNGLDAITDIWFAHSENDSYIYWNKIDKKWWIDKPSGEGVWIVDGPSHAPPARGWGHITIGSTSQAPMVRTYRKILDY